MLSHATPAEWRVDLNYLMDALIREHCNIFHSVSHERLDTAVRSLRRRLSGLAAHEIVIEMARLVALVGDGHTCLPLDESPRFRRYPLRIYHFADGLFVQGSASEHADVVGAQLLAIGDLPAIEAYDAMRPLISRDNEMGVRTAAPVLLTIPEVLHACGVLDDPERASFVVQQPGGKQLTCILRPVETPFPDLIDARDGAAAPPLWLQRPPEQNWCKYLSDAGALYVQYSQVRDGHDERLEMFFDRVFVLIEREAVGRLILDITLTQATTAPGSRPTFPPHCGPGTMRPTVTLPLRPPWAIYRSRPNLGTTVTGPMIARGGIDEDESRIIEGGANSRYAPRSLGTNNVRDRHRRMSIQHAGRSSMRSGPRILPRCLNRRAGQRAIGTRLPRDQSSRGADDDPHVVKAGPGAKEGCPGVVLGAVYRIESVDAVGIIAERQPGVFTVDQGEALTGGVSGYRGIISQVVRDLHLYWSPQDADRLAKQRGRRGPRDRLGLVAEALKLARQWRRVDAVVLQAVGERLAAVNVAAEAQVGILVSGHPVEDLLL